MKCKNCGERLEKGSTICGNCGQDNKKKTILIILAVIVGLAAIAGIVAAVVTTMDKGELEARIIDEETGEYLLTNVPANHTFVITPSESADAEDLAIYDIDGKKASTENVISGDTLEIKAPAGGYEKGEIYTLDLGDSGTFTGEGYRKAKKLLFIIEQKETTEITYKEGVKELESGLATLEDDKLRIEGVHKNGDIIVVDTDEDQVDEIYQLTDVQTADGQTTAGYAEPEEGTVYETLDIFYYDEVDLTEAQIDEEAFVGVLEEMGILDAFVEEAYAESDGDIKVTVKSAEWVEAEGTYTFECTLEDPKNSNRTLEITLGIKDKLLFKANEDKAMVSNTLELTSGLEFTVKGEGKKDTEKKILEAIESYQGNEGTEAGEGEYEVPLVPMTIPIAGPVAAYVDLGLTADISFSAEYNAGVDSSLTFTQGIIYNIDKNKVQKKFAEVEGDLDAHMMVKGKLSAFAGAYLDLGAKVPVLIEVGIKAKGGTYLDGEGCFSIYDIPKDTKCKGYYYVELGLQFTADAKVDVIGLDEKTIELKKNKKPLFKASDYLRLEQTNLKDTYYILDGSVTIEDLTATYLNVIEDEEFTERIDDYTLYVNEEETAVKDGVIQKEFTEGSYDFKIQWKHEGDKFESEQKVQIIAFDPWAHFSSISFIGDSYRSIIDNYGPVINTDRFEGAHILQMDKNNLWAWFSTNDMDFEHYDYYDYTTWVKDDGACIGMGGTAEDMIGLPSGMSIAQLAEALGTDAAFEYTDNNEFTPPQWWAEKTVDGRQHTINITEDRNGYVTQDTQIEIF